jgi:hypothetical protein
VLPEWNAAEGPADMHSQGVMDGFDKENGHGHVQGDISNHVIRGYANPASMRHFSSLEL